MLENDREKFRVDAGRRLLVLGGLHGVLLSAIGGRLFYLQVVQESIYKTMAENNRISLQPVPPPRGRIFDRFGKVLVENRPDYRLTAIPELTKDLKGLLDKLTSILDIPPEEIRAVLKQAKGQMPFFPLTVKSHLTWEELSRVEVQIYDLPGTKIQIQSRRHYPNASLASHVLGYLNEVSKKDMDTFKEIRFRPGDVVGRGGVERRMEPLLRGEEGMRQMEVTALGREVRELSVNPPKPGKDLLLTIDIDLQKEAEAALEGKSGAVVALDPRSGEVLVMASQPAYDPNRFVRGIPSALWRELTGNPKRPLTNKAIQGQYPPGSTFKMVVALAGLAEGRVTPQTEFFCPGYLERYGHRYHCWKRHGHGNVGVVQAIAQSCDVYFYRVAEKLGIDLIEKYGRLVGLGSKTGIPLDGEVSGVLPSSSWKEKALKTIWYPGETYINAIGQGYVQATPLQLACMAAAFANGSTLYRPKLVRQVRGGDAVERGYEPEVVSHSNLHEEALYWVRKGMAEVLNGPRGTARRYRPDGDVIAAGKTGTSQVVRVKRDERGKALDAEREEHKDHAIFISYAPFDEPEIAIGLVVEHGEHGSSGAAPVAKRIMDRYFQRAKESLT